MRRKINEKSPSSVPVLSSNCEVILVEKRMVALGLAKSPTDPHGCQDPIVPTAKAHQCLGPGRGDVIGGGGA